MENNVEQILESCISDGNRKSFFLFAGAGSGKTYTLVRLLNKIKEKWESKLSSEGKHVAVITYTNAATDEIISRLDYSQLFHISTIHSFIWDVIKPYQLDIRKYYISFKEEELGEVMAKLEKAKKKEGKTYESNLQKSKELKSKIEKAMAIERFIYNPNGNNFEFNALSHTDVIKLAARMITENQLLQELIAQQYPFLLIDESQDTKSDLVDAFFEIERNFQDIFTIGLLGDQKQRIYTDGKENIVGIIPENWEKPVKIMNYRCSKRIVKLANSIGKSIDKYAEQNHRQDASEGLVRLFLVEDKDGLDKTQVENVIGNKMAELTGEAEWKLDKNGVKILALEHMMAARRLGFAEFFDAMRKSDKYGQTLLQGLVDDMDVFTKLSFPLIAHIKSGDNVSALNLLKRYSPLINSLPEKDAFHVFDKCIENVRLLVDLFEQNVSIREFVSFVFSSHLFEVPKLLVQASEMSMEQLNVEDKDELIYNWVQVMNLPISQISIFDNYVNRKTMFDTHQGVKGLEFDRVLVILDDKESNGFLFSYDKLLGVKPLSDTDQKNIDSGKDSSLERTTRLFYVICTRAKKSLAVVMYTSNPEAAKSRAISNGWFNDDEIELL